MADERLQELERRVAELEGIVRQLLVRSIAAPLGRSARELPARTTAPAPSAAPAAPVAPRVMVKPKVEIPPSGGPSDRGIDFEQWVGQRGLLIVGVLALLATGGFFLNYAILHGWIPPVVRAEQFWPAPDWPWGETDSFAGGCSATAPPSSVAAAGSCTSASGPPPDPTSSSDGRSGSCCSPPRAGSSSRSRSVTRWRDWRSGRSPAPISRRSSCTGRRRSRRSFSPTSP